MSHTNDGTIQIVVEGVQRVRMLDWVAAASHIPRVSHEEELTEEEIAAAQGKALVRQAHSLFDRFTQLSRRINAEEIDQRHAQITDPGKLADALASHVVTEYQQQQELLETLNPLDRLEKALRLARQRDRDPRAGEQDSPARAPASR